MPEPTPVPQPLPVPIALPKIAESPAGSAVLIPVKSFRAAKRRLAAALDAAERAALARAMATRVVLAAAPLPVAVVCDDDEVAQWATEQGATVVWRPGTGLNAAVHEGVRYLRDAGHDEIVIAHADLPQAVDLRVVCGFAGVTIVPDRRGDGTNVLCLPASLGFEFHYGAGSFARHRAEAARLGADIRVLHDDALGWDVDLPDDLVGVPFGLVPRPTTGP
jgi:2-phospho-L-lactate guanylyltransferase